MKVTAILYCSVSATLLMTNVKAEGFLRAGPHNLKTSGFNFQSAMDEVLGCGNGAEEASIKAIEQTVLPIWKALPKNEHQRVEWRLLRFLAHRYFMQKSSWMIRGFEPMRQVNMSHAGYAEILHKNSPAAAASAMERGHTKHGYSLEDAVAMISALEQVLFDSESSLLERVYWERFQSPHALLGRNQLQDVLEDYIIQWMLGEDTETIALFRRNTSLRNEVFPQWRAIKAFLKGTLQSMEFAQHQIPQLGRSHVGFSQKYSFQDAHNAVGGIAKGFSAFWETECQDIKKSLVAMDTSGTGRVRLSDFYGSNMNGEWRFGESEAYLRELGALDESSAWRGKQVIISNYMQGASNCIVSTPHYLVCCVNECETILHDVESAVGSPLAEPDQVMELLGNVTDLDDTPPKLDHALRDQLERIADNHGGRIPLHGRLFAQWLHYVFPRECPFPHKTGTASAQTPFEFGDKFVASQDEKVYHVQTVSNETESAEETHWMSQWSEEEELIADYSLHLHAPWENKLWRAPAGALALLAVFGWVGSRLKNDKIGSPTSCAADKCHFV